MFSINKIDCDLKGKEQKRSRHGCMMEKDESDFDNVSMMTFEVTIMLRSVRLGGEMSNANKSKIIF